MYRRNPLLRTDSYKYSHWLQYPPGTTMIESYIESRGAKHFGNEVQYSGLQGFLKDHLIEPFTKADLDEAIWVTTLHFGSDRIFPAAGFQYILEKYGGVMPVSIRALDEGTLVPSGTPLVIVRSTDPAVPWVTSFLETSLLRAIWAPTTTGTISFTILELIYKMLGETADEPMAELPFKLHDFGARGVSSGESASIAGASHLMNFMGTDNVEAIEYLRYLYDAPCAGFSIPAAEHSTITSWGPTGEKAAYQNMLKQFGDGLVAVVSDSYDIFNAVDHIWGEELNAEVTAMKGMLVVRPDSGDPVEVNRKLIKMLDAKFGSTVNSKGYKVLNHVRLIQGDGVSAGVIRLLLWHLRDDGYSTTNIAFGMGGALLQHMDRDWLQFAMKCNLIEQDGQLRRVSKNPIGDPEKNSKGGDLDVVISGGKYQYVDHMTPNPINDLPSAMKVRYENGSLLNQTDLTEIRERVKATLLSRELAPV